MIEEKTSVREKVDELNKLAFEIRNTDTRRAITLSKEAQALSAEISYEEGKATGLNNEGFCYVQITDYELALEKCFEALRIFTEIKNEMTGWKWRAATFSSDSSTGGWAIIKRQLKFMSRG